MLKEEIGQDPSHWTVADVVKYITSVGFPEQAAAFKTQVSTVSNHQREYIKKIFIFQKACFALCI